MGIGPDLIGTARQAVRLGHSEADVRVLLRTKYPHASRTQILSVVRTEIVRQKNVDYLMTHDRGQFANIPGATGCPPGTGRVRIGITVTVKNDTTGQTKQFGHTAESTKAGTIRKLINDAIKQAEEAARGAGYTPYGLSEKNEPLNAPHYEITYVDCL
jgi:hypothetical protein